MSRHRRRGWWGARRGSFIAPISFPCGSRRMIHSGIDGGEPIAAFVIDRRAVRAAMGGAVEDPAIGQPAAVDIENRRPRSRAHPDGCRRGRRSPRPARRRRHSGCRRPSSISTGPFFIEAVEPGRGVFRWLAGERFRSRTFRRDPPCRRSCASRRVTQAVRPAARGHHHQ